MKFILIITVLLMLYTIIKSKRHSKEKTNNINNMILCKKCGFHVLRYRICGSDEEQYNCPNINEK